MSLPIFLLGLLSVGSVSADFTLTVLHTNDFATRVEQINKYGTKCDASRQACYGGSARLATVVKNVRAGNDKVLVLDGGDMLEGALWAGLEGGAAIPTLMAMIGYDAIGLGNHEFDTGPKGLTPILQHMKQKKVSALSCNLHANAVPSMQGLYSKSIVKVIGGRKIGIVGYTTPDTSFLSAPGDLTFTDIVECVKAETASLRARGVRIVLAVGHAGLEMDKRIAREVPGISLVVGGHDNHFFFNGPAPAQEVPEGPYPLIVEGSTSGRKTSVPVVQAYQYGKYMGHLKLTYDDDGMLVHWKGNPILLDKHTQEDNATLAAVERYTVPLEAYLATVVGTTRVVLNADKNTTRRMESNLGNCVTDALLWFAMQRYRK